MYTYEEIRFIFSQCLNWEDLQRACNAFSFLIKEGCLDDKKRKFLSIIANERFKKIENLD